MSDQTENHAESKFVGRVSAVRGSVVDAVFDRALPPIDSILRAGPEDSIVIEVMDHLDSESVRGISLTPSAGLGRGDFIRGDGRPLQAPVGSRLLGRMFNVFGQTIDGKARPEDLSFRTVHQAPISLSRRVTKEKIFVTGIKAIDLLVPL
ncbi:MAG: F0F1 ATP synthase subunit beta, partial [Desulfobacterales bacterium]|nr:F0F1 ATP synthase subunit beta [Desulfobacterales bacterium]